MQSFSTFYGSQVENHAHMNAEFVPCREGRDAAGRRFGVIHHMLFAVWQKRAAALRPAGQGITNARLPLFS